VPHQDHWTTHPENVGPLILLGLAALLCGFIWLLARPNPGAYMAAYEPPLVETPPPSTARTSYPREREQQEEHEVEMTMWSPNEVNDDEVEQQPRRRRLKSEQAPTQLLPPETPGTEDSASPAQLVRFISDPQIQLLLTATAVVLVMAISMMVPVLRWWERNRAFLKTFVTQKRRELVQAAPKNRCALVLPPSSSKAQV